MIAIPDAKPTPRSPAGITVRRARATRISGPPPPNLGLDPLTRPVRGDGWTRGCPGCGGWPAKPVLQLPHPAAKLAVAGHAGGGSL